MYCGVRQWSALTLRLLILVLAIPELTAFFNVVDRPKDMLSAFLGMLVQFSCAFELAALACMYVNQSCRFFIFRHSRLMRFRTCTQNIDGANLATNGLGFRV